MCNTYTHTPTHILPGMWVKVHESLLISCQSFSYPSLCCSLYTSKTLSSKSLTNFEKCKCLLCSAEHQQWGWLHLNFHSYKPTSHSYQALNLNPLMVSSPSSAKQKKVMPLACNRQLHFQSFKVQDICLKIHIIQLRISGVILGGWMKLMYQGRVHVTCWPDLTLLDWEQIYIVWKDLKEGRSLKIVMLLNICPHLKDMQLFLISIHFESRKGLEYM